MIKNITKAPVIGFVRYSQKISFGNETRNMFEPEYFEYRFNIFKKVTLKSFQQQTNTNFVLLLLHSVNMPDDYKERFYQLEQENSFLYNVFMEDTQESFNETIINSKEYVSFENEVAVNFRIDNDDAVQKDFIEKLSTFQKNDFFGYAISLPTLYIVKRISENRYMLQERYYPANSIGLAYVTGKKQYKTVFNLGDHDLVNNNNSLLLLEASKNGSLQTINGENAINAIDKNKTKVMSELDLYEYLSENKIEKVNLDCLNIFDKGIDPSKITLKKIIALFTPPIVSILFNKIKRSFV